MDLQLPKNRPFMKRQTLIGFCVLGAFGSSVSAAVSANERSLILGNCSTAGQMCTVVTATSALPSGGLGNSAIAPELAGGEFVRDAKTLGNEGTISIPELSSALIGGIGALVLLMRKR